MKLNRKTFVYSIVLAIIIIILFLSYMLLILPSLYIEHSNRTNLNDVIEIHNNYVKNKKYNDGIKFNSINSFSAYLPKDEYNINFSNYYFNGEVKIVKEELRDGIEKFRRILKSEEDVLSKNNYDNYAAFFDEATPRALVEEIKKVTDEYVDISFVPTEFSKNYNKEMGNQGEYKNLGKDTGIFISKSNNKKNAYTNYMILTNRDEDIFISFFSLLTPLISDIRTPIYSSIPMIVMVILLIVLFTSRFFSKKLVDPILEISRHTEDSKDMAIEDIPKLEIKTNDEIEQLAIRLNELYNQLKENYSRLKKENKRKEVFMRSSSHQLKTPVSSALLLTDGMIDKIGRYENRDKYLLELKKQLQDISKIIGNILELNQLDENLEFEKIKLMDIITTILSKYKVIIEEKNLNIKLPHNSKEIYSNYEIFYKILDNIISNGIMYSPENADIIFLIEENYIKIINADVKIPKDIEDSIFEPFVSSNDTEKGHGLGLYLVNYYIELLDYGINIKNIDIGVMAEIYFN